MNFTTGRVEALYIESGLRMAKVNVGGAQKAFLVELLPDLQEGDYVMLHAGVALSKVDEDRVLADDEALRG